MLESVSFSEVFLYFLCIRTGLSPVYDLEPLGKKSNEEEWDGARVSGPLTARKGRGRGEAHTCI